jgi:hypothetical protein
MKWSRKATDPKGAGATKGAPKLNAVPPGDPRDRGGKVQPMLTVSGLKKHLPI